MLHLGLRLGLAINLLDTAPQSSLPKQGPLGPLGTIGTYGYG